MTPMNHREAAKKLGMTSRVFHAELGRLKRRMGVRVRDQKLFVNGKRISEQDYVASIRRAAEQLSRPSNDFSIKGKEPTVHVAASDIERRTGYSPELLVNAGVEFYDSLETDPSGTEIRTLTFVIPRRLDGLDYSRRPGRGTPAPHWFTTMA